MILHTSVNLVTPPGKGYKRQEERKKEEEEEETR